MIIGTDAEPQLLPLANGGYEFKLIQLFCFLEFLAKIADLSLSPRLLFLKLELFLKILIFRGQNLARKKIPSS